MVWSFPGYCDEVFFRFDFCLETPLERITWSSDLAFSFCLCFWQAPNTEILCLESRMRSQNIPFLHGDA